MIEIKSLYTGAVLKTINAANLRGANLRGADLYGANLRGADLYGADLHGADLYGANLRGANLRGADLYGANLYGADLYGADLYGADLRGANLRGADLYGADLYGAKNIPSLAAAQTLIVPAGDLIVWKKLQGGTICKLRIPSDAMRLSGRGRKCRAEFAEVLEGEGVSQHDNSFEYKVGKIVRPDSFDEDRWNECSNGIHFFLTREEAEAY